MPSPTSATRLLLGAVTLFCTSAAMAEPPKTDGLWRGTGGAALAVTSGNSDTTAFNLSADVAARTTADKISLGGAYNYGRNKAANGVATTTADRWNAYGQYDYNLSPALFVFGKLGLEGDKLTALSLRGTAAGGLGYRIIDTQALAFSVFGGAAYSADRYDRAQTIGGVSDTRFSRTSLFIGEESSHVLSSTTTFKQRLELYPGLTGDKAKIARFTAALGVAMSNTMSLSVGLTNTYNSAPPAGREKNDLGLFTGINVKLGAN